jgi:fumarylacetoacetate (FAA) hydrolase
MVEKLVHGLPSTPFLRFGDGVRIEMKNAVGNSIFDAIEQRVERVKPPTVTSTLDMSAKGDLFGSHSI